MFLGVQGPRSIVQPLYYCIYIYKVTNFVIYVKKGEQCSPREYCSSFHKKSSNAKETDFNGPS